MQSEWQRFGQFFSPFFIGVTIAAALIIACGQGADIVSGNGSCGAYPEESTSEYKMPVAVGTTTTVSQANCSQFTHSGIRRFAYDFDLDPGDPVHAARAGTVSAVGTSTMSITHDDGTVAIYAQLEESGHLVGEGETVSQGQQISEAEELGSEGESTHVHLEVREDSSQGAQTIPITFSNTREHPFGLVKGESYTAE